MIDVAIAVISSNLAEENNHNPYWKTEEFQTMVTRKWAFSQMLDLLSDHPNDSPLDTIGLFMTQLDICRRMAHVLNDIIMFDTAREAAEEVLMCLV